MYRTIVAGVAAITLVASASASVGAAPKNDAAAVELKFSVVDETITDAFTTGNDKWFHVNGVDIAVVGSGTMGDETVVFTGGGSAKSHTSLPADPSLPPGFGDIGWAHVSPAYADFTTLEDGRTFSCDGWFHLERATADPPFPFAYDDGRSKWRCDDGRRLTADLRGYFELDPVSGLPVFVIEVTGTIR